MKKAILLAVCALFIGAAAFAQSEEKKPTKEETIKWLTEKLEVYYQPPIVGEGVVIDEISIEINECNIKVFCSAYPPAVHGFYVASGHTYYKFGREGKKNIKLKVVFPTRFMSISDKSFSDDFGGSGNYSYKQLNYDDKVILLDCKSDNDDSSIQSSINKTFIISSCPFLRADTPSTMVERIDKAIRHLSTFCNNGDDLF